MEGFKIISVGVGVLGFYIGDVCVWMFLFFGWNLEREKLGVRDDDVVVGGDGL